MKAVYILCVIFGVLLGGASSVKRKPTVSERFMYCGIRLVGILIAAWGLLSFYGMI